MTSQQAQDLLRYSIVMRNGDPNFKGTVMEVGYTGFSVRWENGTNEWVTYRGAKQIDLWQPKEPQP